MRKQLPDELWYKSYFQHKIIDKNLSAVYEIPKHLKPRYEKPWQSLEITPERLELTDDERLPGGQYWDYIAISVKHYNLHGTYLNRAEVQYVIKHKLTPGEKKLPRFLENLEAIRHALELLDAAEDKEAFFYKHIKPLL